MPVICTLIAVPVVSSARSVAATLYQSNGLSRRYTYPLHPTPTARHNATAVSSTRQVARRAKTHTAWNPVQKPL